MKTHAIAQRFNTYVVTACGVKVGKGAGMIKALGGREKYWRRLKLVAPGEEPTCLRCKASTQ